MKKTILNTEAIAALTVGNGEVVIPLERAYEPFLIKDNHNNGDSLIKCHGVYILNRGLIALMADAKVYCLNAVELVEGAPTLSIHTVAGNVKNNIYTGWYDTYPVEMIEFENEAEMASWMEGFYAGEIASENQDFHS